jgi:hypothetical protein
VVVDDSGVPQVKRLLADCSHEQLRTAVRAAAPA